MHACKQKAGKERQKRNAEEGKERSKHKISSLKKNERKEANIRYRAKERRKQKHTRADLVYERMCRCYSITLYILDYLYIYRITIVRNTSKQHQEGFVVVVVIVIVITIVNIFVVFMAMIVAVVVVVAAAGVVVEEKDIYKSNPGIR